MEIGLLPASDLLCDSACSFTVSGPRGVELGPARDPEHPSRRQTTEKGWPEQSRYPGLGGSGALQLSRAWGSKAFLAFARHSGVLA